MHVLENRGILDRKHVLIDENVDEMLEVRP